MRREIRIGMSVYWATIDPETVDGEAGYRWEANRGRVKGWARGTIADALLEIRKQLGPKAVEIGACGRAWPCVCCS